MYLNDFRAQIIDVTDVDKPTERESFWIEKLNTIGNVGVLSFLLEHKNSSHVFEIVYHLKIPLG